MLRNLTLNRGRDGSWLPTLALDVVLFLLGLLVGFLFTAAICAS